MRIFMLGVQNQPAFGNVPELPTLLLSGIVWVPTIVAIGLLLFPTRTEVHRERIRSIAIGACSLVTALAVLMWYGFKDQGGTFAYDENRSWLPSLGASYHLGVDGISMPMVLLSSILFLMAVLASSRIRERVKEYFFLILLLETGVNGTFSSLDFLLFFLFWQMQLIPLTFLMGIWGGARKLLAAWKYLFFGLAGSSLLLIAILILYYTAPAHTFDMLSLRDAKLPVGITSLLFWLFFSGFAIQLPAFPLHSWFVDAQAEAPAPAAAVLAGAVVKLGAYGLIRVNLGQFPDLTNKYGNFILGAALVTIIYSLVAALREDDLRRIIAYATQSHMGLVLLAVSAAAPIAINGGVLMMVADGLTAATLLLLAAALYERTGTRSIRELGGLAARMPRAAVVWTMAALAAMGAPGLAGFVAQLLIFLGSYPVHRRGTLIAVAATVLMAGLMLWTLQRIFFGPIREGYGRVRDLGSLEMTYAVGLVALVVLLGVFPAALVDNINLGVLSLLSRGG
jgi:NADH-quinone oxidoreductase subunit M